VTRSTGEKLDGRTFRRKEQARHGEEAPGAAHRPEPLPAGQYVEFDLNEVLKGNPKERFEALKAADFLTPNEKRALENRDRVDDPRADMLWMPLNMMPIGEGAVAMEERLARLQAAKATEEGR